MNKTLLFYCIVPLFIFLNGCKGNRDSNDEVEKFENMHSTIVKEKWHWDRAQKQNEGAGYAQIVKVGTTLYISGVPTSDLSEEGITKLYKSLGDCLAAYGASFKNVVKENLYTTDIATMKKLNEARKAFYNGDFPAATWVQVSGFYEANTKLEVDFIAELMDGE